MQRPDLLLGKVMSRQRVVLLADRVDKAQRLWDEESLCQRALGVGGPLPSCEHEGPVQLSILGSARPGLSLGLAPESLRKDFTFPKMKQ